MAILLPSSRLGHLIQLLLMLLANSARLSWAQQPPGFPCDNPRNSDLPFCDSGLPIDSRVQDLISRLTLDEKLGMMDHTAEGASLNVALEPMNWWNEALHGVAGSPNNPHIGTRFRPPTEYATVFPQIISLASSFNRQLFYRMANVTGDEARAFFHAGNSGITFWSPDINIYRDPRWGRGHETPGEDPLLSSEFAKQFVRGLQGAEESGEAAPFIKVAACCKHFVAHSAEEERFSFDSIVTEQDLADTYLPAFKACAEANVACYMCAYNAVNGVPACAHKHYFTDLIRGEWGFDGYTISDCDSFAVTQYGLGYRNDTSETCRAVLDAGLDKECHYWIEFFEQYLRKAVNDGAVSVATHIDPALARTFRVLMRTGYFEKDAARPYKELQPAIVDQLPHRSLALEAARESIVLLKNAANARTGQPTLPLNQQLFKSASMALIGPHVQGSYVFLGNYHGVPSFIRSPVDGFRAYVPDLEYEQGCQVKSTNMSGFHAAIDLARTSSQVVLVVGISSGRNDDVIENEDVDRHSLLLPGLQKPLIERVLETAQQPVILIVVSGGCVEISEYENDPRVGAIIWAGYLGQSAGDAMADVVFGGYNPAGRTTQTWYSNEYMHQVSKLDMNMRPDEGGNGSGSPGRTYRFFTGQPIYPFGHGLSYTAFEYTITDAVAVVMAKAEAEANFTVTVRNVGQRAGDHSVLWYLAPPDAGMAGRPIKSLTGFERLSNVLPGESRQVDIKLSPKHFQLANEAGEWEMVIGEWRLLVENLEKIIVVA